MPSPRTMEILNRLELLAIKFGKTVEEIVDILEGKSETHRVVLKVAPKTPAPVADVNASSAAGNAVKNASVLPAVGGNGSGGASK